MLSFEVLSTVMRWTGSASTGMDESTIEKRREWDWTQTLLLAAPR